MFCKGSPWPKQVRSAAISAVEMGGYFKTRVTSGTNHTCTSDDRISPKLSPNEPLNIHNLSGAFALVVLGTASGMLAIFLEVIVHKVLTKKRSAGHFLEPKPRLKRQRSAPAGF